MEYFDKHKSINQSINQSIKVFIQDTQINKI